MSRISIIGAGAWGTGLAIVLGRKGTHQVRLWAHEADVCESITHKHVNEKFLPGRTIPGWFKAEKVGNYGIGCAQICGAGHTVMGATLVVQSQHDYDEWLKK